MSKLEELTRPIIGIENRTAKEVFDIMCDRITAALAAMPTPAEIVPPHCSGYSFVFEPGVLHVRKNGSGYIAINEDDFVLEDDRDVEGGSVHWITRLDASEVTALRDFLNGTTAPHLHVLPSADEIDALIECLLDAQQDINLSANETMSQPLCDASALIDEVEKVLRRVRALAAENERLRKNLSPILHLIRQFAEDTNERNWADKRLYIKQQAERAIGEIALERT